MKKSLTRVLVLSGAVTLSNARGSAEGHAAELLIAPQGDAPTKIVANSGGDFGFDLLRELVTRNPNAGGCVSPYSIACALSMTAEGARGPTAEEMARVLRLPPGARRQGEDAQRIPFEWSQIHAGYGAIQERFDKEAHARAETEARTKLAELRRREAGVAKRIAEARASRDRDRARALRTERRQIAAEIKRAETSIARARVEIANALWGDETYAFRPEFIEAVQSAYGTGAVVAADFRGAFEAERARINAWVAEATHGNIDELIGEDVLDPLTTLVLLNAIWFKGDWVSPFAVENTASQPFTTLDGARVDVPMMHASAMATARYGAFAGDGSWFATTGGAEGQYPDEDGFQVLELPYRGGEVSMVLLLPTRPDGLRDLEERLSAARVTDWLARLEPRSVHVQVPKFEVQTSIDLKSPLIALGMQRAFDRNRADFTGMSPPDTKFEQQLFISAALHQATITVNEAGTEASAATAVVMRMRGGRPNFVPTFRADRPFVYLIRDTNSGTVLFLGRYTGS